MSAGNAILGARHALGADNLVSEAEHRTGLSYGTTEFLEPLRRLTEALADEAKLTEAGVATFRERLIHQLATSIRMEEYIRRFPEIEQEEIVAPVFIIGPQRTGTTKLQRVLAADPKWHTLKMWEGMSPVPLDPSADLNEDRLRRIGYAQEYSDLHNNSGARAAHEMHPLAPEEEVLLFLQTFLVPPYEYCAPAYNKWLENFDYLPAYRFFKRQLMVLQWQKRQVGAGEGFGRWVLKAGMHLHHLPCLTSIFPDAHLVQTHRDPETSLASLLKMSEMINRNYSDSFDLGDLGELWLGDLSRSLLRSMNFRESHPEVKILDLGFSEVTADSIASARKIYEFSDVPFTDETERLIKAWDAEHPRHQHGQHSYDHDFSRYSLSSQKVEDAFSKYRELFADLL